MADKRFGRMFNYIIKKESLIMMINNHEKHAFSLGQQPQRLLRHEVESRLVDEVARLLSHEPEEGLGWQGSGIDLMEALHVVFATGMLEDDDGCMLQFRAIVRRACSVLHVREPRNPYELAAKASRRKGIRRSTFMRRYQLRLGRDDKTPFLDEIAKN